MLSCRLFHKSNLSRSKTFLRYNSSSTTSQPLDCAYELGASNLRFGPGATAEVGYDLRDAFGVKRVVVFTDSNVGNLSSMQILLESLSLNKLEVTVYDAVRVEPNDISFKHAIDWLSRQQYDAVVAFGGGSVIDTAKAANLYARFPPNDFYDYVNPPVGKGMPVPSGSLPPVIAIPTTAGTGSETTGVAIFDDSSTKSKTGIANRRLKPTLGIVDPNNTVTLPREVATYSGLDVLCHAIESYTAMPFNRRPKPPNPTLRPAYQGSNPISDVWSLFALNTAARCLPRAVRDGNEDDRAQMLLASSAAGLGFGNAGVHLCHGMSYPIASQVGSYRPSAGYNSVDHAIVPHGLSVIVTAPSVFSFTGEANPERHAKCAKILAEARLGVSNVDYNKLGGDDDAGLWLADEIREIMQLLNVPIGIRSLGYSEEDIPSLVEGTLPQHRVTKISPRAVGAEELHSLFTNALDN